MEFKNNRTIFLVTFYIRPYAYQKEILEKLQVERKIFNKNRNLVIASTDVGKTVISAFDYRDFYKENMVGLIECYLWFIVKKY